jgi:hypothetical protein
MTTTLEPFSFRITYVHEDGSHVIGIRFYEKKVVFLNVASADKSNIGDTVRISTAKCLSESDCPPKFYKAYGITDPYTHGWKFQRLVTGTVVFEEPPTFRPIPIAKAEEKVSLMDAMTIGSTWSNAKNRWVIKDKHLERLAGVERLRVWVTDENGKRGQALYADSLMQAYKRTQS